MNANEILNLINSKPWYHAYEIIPGIFSPGKLKVDPKFVLDYYGVSSDLTGKSAIDIGAWDGPYTFELERRGANAFALDIQDPDHTGFNIAKRLKNSSATYIRSSIYEIPDDFLNKFDIVLFAGVYYHLKDPLLAFKRIWQILKNDGNIYYEGAILDYANNIDSFWQDKADLLKQLSLLPLSYFTASKYAADLSNWFIPTIACLNEWLKASGFTEIKMLEPNREFSRAGGSAKKDMNYNHFEHSII